MVKPANALMRLSECLRGDAQFSDLPTHDREMLADGLDRYLAGRDPLDVALGVKPGPGQRDPRTVARLAERDRLLCEAAAAFFDGEKNTVQARKIHRKWMDYVTTGWRFDCRLTEPPAHRTGKIESRLFLVMKTHDGVLSERSIRLILAASSVFSLPAPPHNLGPTEP